MKTYKCVDGVEGFAALDISMPTRWSCGEIKLASNSRSVVVELGCPFVMAADFDLRRLKAYVAKYSLANAVVGEEIRAENDSGYFFAFYLVEWLGLEANVWTLSQADSPVFSDRPEKGDYLLVDKSKKVALQQRVSSPRWKWSEAIWPTVDGEPMAFAGELDVVGDQADARLAMAGEKVFWFFAHAGGELRFKAVTQQITFQTAEDHYVSEVKRRTRHR